MLGLIHDNFNIEKYVDDFLTKIGQAGEQQIPAIALKMFGDAGKLLAKNVIEISDNEENRDRGYQILREYCLRPENSAFPHLIQRFIEVVYLSINPKLPEVGLLEASRAKLTYWIDEDDCHVYEVIKGKCDETVLTHMPCQYLCTHMLNELAMSWGVKDYEINMDAMMAEDHLCKFNICQPGVILPKVPIMRWEE